MRNAGDVEHWILVRERIEPGVIAKRTLGAKLVQLHIAFENDLRVCRHFQIHGFALHQFDGLLAQKAGNQELLHIGRRGNNGGKRERRIGSNRHRNFHPPGGLPAVR